MDFWGYDRSFTSLRLDALVRILQHPTDKDIQLLSSLFPTELGKESLTAREVEILIAVSSGAKKTPEAFVGMNDYLYHTLLLISTLLVTVPDSFVGTARDLYAHRVGELPSNQVSKDLTSFFIKQGKVSILNDFLDYFDQHWAKIDHSNSKQSKTALGALIGFFEGIMEAKRPEILSLKLIQRINEYCKPEFLASTHEGTNPGYDNSTTGSESITDSSITSVGNGFSNYDTSLQILVKTAAVASLYSTAAGDELSDLAKLSVEQLEGLETSHIFQSNINAHSVHLIEEAFYYHLLVVSEALKSNMVELDAVDAIISRALSDPTYEYSPLIVLISELTARVIRNDERKLYSVIPKLPDYFGGVDSSSSYHSARKFADVFKANFKTESSRINLLYAFTNKLNEEEYKIYAAAHGESDAVAFISSLLSALMALVVSFDNSELANMMGSLLSQKYGTINEQVDCQIIETWGLLAPYLTKEKFTELLEVLTQAALPDSPEKLKAVKNARISIANKNKYSQTYLEYLLNLLVIKGNPSYATVARGIFSPLAVLVSKHTLVDDWTTQDSSRNAWFSLASMGFTFDSLNAEDLNNLSIIAKWAPPLVSETSVNRIDSDIQLNPVLVRGTSAEVLKIQRSALSKIHGHMGGFASNSVKSMFMASVLLLEGLRCQAGVISRLPYYFAETDFASGEGYSHMHQIVMFLGREYVRNLGNDSNHTLDSVSLEVKRLVVLAAHRVEGVRNCAAELVTLVISSTPAALCKSSTLWALLDCISLLGDSVKNVIEDPYSPKAVFTSPDTDVTIELGDYLEVRTEAYRSFEKNASEWLAIVSEKMSAELKPRLSAYIGNGSRASGKGRRFALSVLAADDLSDNFMSQYFMLNRYDTSEVLTPKKTVNAVPGSIEGRDLVIQQLREVTNSDELHDAYTAATPHIRVASLDTAALIVKETVKAAFKLFTGPAISTGIVFWNHISRHRREVRSVITNQVIEESILSAENKKGVFSREFDECLPLWSEMEYAPTDKKALDRQEKEVVNLFEPHHRLLTEYIRGNFHGLILVNPLYVPMFTRLAFSWLNCLAKHGSLHSLARALRLQILNFVNEVVVNLLVLQKRMVALRQITSQLEQKICNAGLAWFQQPVCQWTYGSNTIQEQTVLKLIRKSVRFISRYEIKEANLLCEFLSQEYNKLAVWHSPLSPQQRLDAHGFDYDDLQLAWNFDPILIIRIATSWSFRGNGSEEYRLICEFVEKNILSFIGCEEALPFYLKNRKGKNIDNRVLYWTQLSPISSINLLSPSVNAENPMVIQLALRSLQSHPVTKCFFYVPQIVQQLRHDRTGYVEEYILEAAKFSQKFAHQIIWNLMANMYNDDDGTVPSDMKPKLEHVLAEMKNNFDAKEKAYYETEFNFFSEITGISGKLKPYIKKSKAEKKSKIDEEMANIKVPDDVYLPSHPDGTVVDIDRLSGKPLQSHAKAPFMASFKLRVTHPSGKHDTKEVTNDIWQSAIFKVGDDCRQDVLALQIISVFRSIYNYCGLDVYVFPYKVTATAAGRGIIDVLPSSVSRDMLGREAVNGLDQWFRSKYGGPESIEFQRARLNFVKSLAAYSVISYLIQFKDRHNGNIMYDADGHIIHIDFGFCFDIVPGGVKFEAAPFKLTKEMVQVMGGSAKALPYQWFEEQCVRAFLASRVFVDDICRVVEPMLDSGLPCFKGHTIKRLRDRFALNKTEAEAAHHMRSLISKSHESNYTKGYDEFQRITNGIPH